MKRNPALFLTILIIVSIFVLFGIAGKYNLVLDLPYFDKVTVPNINAFANWITGSVATLSIMVNLLQWLKIKAIKSPGTLDDKIITYLINFFSLNWFKEITKKEESKNE